MTKGLLPWQNDLLQRMEDRDVDAEFQDLTRSVFGNDRTPTRGLPRPDVPKPPRKGAQVTHVEIDGEEVW